MKFVISNTKGSFADYCLDNSYRIKLKDFSLERHNANLFRNYYGDSWIIDIISIKDLEKIQGIVGHALIVDFKKSISTDGLNLDGHIEIYDNWRE